VGIGSLEVGNRAVEHDRFNIAKQQQRLLHREERPSRIQREKLMELLLGELAELP
jgi:hypothetical protein